jgi:hypothetical protein
VSPWLIVGIVVYWVLAFWFAARLGEFLRGPRVSAPPAGPRARAVRTRERAGHVEILPGFGDAENAWKRPQR